MRRLLSVSVLALALVGCPAEEHALLLEFSVPAASDDISDGDRLIEELRVDVRFPGSGRDAESRAVTIGRTVADIAEAPLKVSVESSVPTRVSVRIVVQDADGVSVGAALRCHQLSGVVRDTFELALPGVGDADGDGWPGGGIEGCGTPCDVEACDAALADCDDAVGSVHPFAIETCGADLNCDPDDEVPGCGDADNDGFDACPPGVRGECDCDDQDPAVNPSLDEPCDATFDINCDGVVGVCDRDGDGVPADREVGGSPDCDDTNDAVYPGAQELCTVSGEPVDEDCDGTFDEVEGCAPDDLDGDGVLADAGDCDDCNAGTRPGLDEVCGDGVDQDCDADRSDLTCATDDGDGDGVIGSGAGGRDCDDTDPAVFPGAPERCGGASGDDDCDGMVDEGCAAGDLDGDGVVEEDEFAACEGDAARTPFADESCNGADDDCDGRVDEGAGGDGGACVRDLTGALMVVNYADSMAHCGGCGMACSPLTADTCTDGLCRCSENRDSEECDPGTVCCAGPGLGCRDLSSSMDACGRCANACEDTADNCTDGACRCGAGPPCAAGLLCCAGSCVDIDEDPNNCGGCGDPCGPRETCASGLCACSDDVASRQGREACTGQADRCCIGRGCKNSCGND